MEKSTLTKQHPVLLSDEHIYSLDDYEINENKEESFPARNRGILTDRDCEIK